jgi:capping protein beta
LFSLGTAEWKLTRTAVSHTSSSSGSWDSIHVFDAQDRARTAHYKLTSTVILSLGTDSDALGGLDLSGNMVRQVEADMAVEDDTSHVANIGKMVEDMELKMRNLLQEVYFGKAKDVVGDLRSKVTKETLDYGTANISTRHSTSQPDEPGPRDTERDD